MKPFSRNVSMVSAVATISVKAVPQSDVREIEGVSVDITSAECDQSL